MANMHQQFKWLFDEIWTYNNEIYFDNEIYTISLLKY